MTTQGIPSDATFPVPGNGSRPAPRPTTMRDDTTRYLCAAAHLDEKFADDAIREFLIESTRPVPPSPGVDAGAVLREAVAARTRRKLRDPALIVLMAGMVLVTSIELLGGWLVLAVALLVPTLASPGRERSTHLKAGLYLLVAATLVLLVTILWPELWRSVPTSLVPAMAAEVILQDALTVLGVAALLTVLLADRLVVWKHLSERFWPRRGTIGPADTRGQAVFRYSPDLFLSRLRRFTFPRATMAPPSPHEPAAPGQTTPAPVLVYRGYKPFVGAGYPQEAWSIAVPLERLPDATVTTALTTDALYAGIRTAIESLREAVALAPSRRLGRLDCGERVIVCADELIDHLDDPEAADFLDQPGVAPFTSLRPERVRSIRAEPVEWARYYQCYEIETWDRDLVLSVFVHVAAGPDALYVEWMPCVLPPIRKKYREIDTMSQSLWRPLLGAVLDLLRLPATIPGRLVHTFTFIRPGRDRPGVVDPDSYGVASSLRELASSQAADNFFQYSDIERYQKMMESRLILAVSRMMRAAGYSPASFDEQASTVVHNNVSIGGNVGGNVVAGVRNRVDRRAAAKPGTARTGGRPSRAP